MMTDQEVLNLLDLAYRKPSPGEFSDANKEAVLRRLEERETGIPSISTARKDGVDYDTYMRELHAEALERLKGLWRGMSPTVFLDAMTMPFAFKQGNQPPALQWHQNKRAVQNKAIRQSARKEFRPTITDLRNEGAIVGKPDYQAALDRLAGGNGYGKPNQQGKFVGDRFTMPEYKKYEGGRNPPTYDIESDVVYGAETGPMAAKHETGHSFLTRRSGGSQSMWVQVIDDYGKEKVVDEILRDKVLSSVAFVPGATKKNTANLNEIDWEEASAQFIGDYIANPDKFTKEKPNLAAVIDKIALENKGTRLWHWVSMGKPKFVQSNMRE